MSQPVHVKQKMRQYEGTWHCLELSQTPAYCSLAYLQYGSHCKCATGKRQAAGRLECCNALTASIDISCCLNECGDAAISIPCLACKVSCSIWRVSAQWY